MSVPVKHLNITCLVVDDQSTMRRTISNMLTRIGFKNILSAEDGKAALSLLEHAKIDLVICDINMPEMTGLELFKILKMNKKFSNLLFIFVTAEVKKNTIARAAEQGDTAYIIKPFVLATLESKIEEVLKKRFEPSPFDQHQKKLQQYMDAMDLQSAEAELNKAMELWPDSPSVLFNLGQVSFRKGSTDKAIELYKRAIEKKPLYVKAYDALAKIYDDLGETQQAIKYYEQAHGISASNPDRLVTLSKLYGKTGEVKKAEVMLKEAASEVVLDESTSGHLLGEMYLAKNENEKALEILINARKKNPSDPSIMLSLADAFRKTGKPEQAIEIYRELLLLKPNDSDIHHAIGKTYLEMGNKASAVEAITKAWELNPASKEITRDLRALAAKSKIKL